jgi:GntR family transcriptional regulator
MPTKREVAVALKVDLNTVRHAYSDLEHTGAIVILRARGTYVAERPPPLDLTRQAERALGLAQQTIATANASGIDPVDVAQQILQIAKQTRGRK